MSRPGDQSQTDRHDRDRPRRTPPKTLPNLAWCRWASKLPSAASARLSSTVAASSSSASASSAAAAAAAADVNFNIPYVRYDNVVILSSKAFRREPLAAVAADDLLRPHLPDLWRELADAFRVRHVGVNAPIPLHLPPPLSSSSSSSSAARVLQGMEDGDASGRRDGADGTSTSGGDASAAENWTSSPPANGTNVLRSPTSFQPLYGDFGGGGGGSGSGNEGGATLELFSPQAAGSTFWASATQHGITQVWSPLHTMFSNGNISEKVRVMGFSPGIGSGDGDGGSEEGKCTAVDLYAGIGYFAFFYRKRVADLVLCWEINEWSVEGFRRGAAANGWAAQTMIVRSDGECSGTEQAEVPAQMENMTSGGLIMFEESNENAAARIRNMRHAMPPVRHVNCGYLPSSAPSWPIAVQALDPELGGWIHAHENIAVKDIEARVREVVEVFRELAQGQLGDKSLIQVNCEHVAQVKTYAPGVMHCVLDIRISFREKPPH